MNVEPLQKYLIEYIIEFTFKQIVERGPSIAKNILERAKQIRVKRIYTPRVDLVDRENVMESIEFVLKESPHVRMLYLSGEGGIGKTRLLEETKKLITSKSEFITLRWGGILDLYHTELHSVSTMQIAIVQALDPLEVYFKEFRVAYERYNHLLTAGLIGQALEKAHQSLNDIFLNEYREFAKNHRAVIAFDTLESLAHESDWVENLCRLEKSSTTARDWIICNATQLENTVILLAGRPQPELEKALVQANSKYPGQLETISLHGLTREETRRYLTLLLKSAPLSLKNLNESVDVLWQLTRGLPVQLALTVELASHGEYVAQTQDGYYGNVELWGQHLIGTLFSFENPDRRLFFFLALARKGLTPDLLHYLEPDWSLEYCRQLVERLHISSVVKTRPENDEIFLHDALYELFDAYFPMKGNVQSWYERLADYYRAEIAAQSDKHLQRFIEVNFLYYELRKSPRLAFESIYLPLREKAITGYELELDLQLRDELLRFLFWASDHNNGPVDNLSKAEVDCDGVVRWIRRYVIQADYQQAIKVAETVLALGPDPYSSFISDPAVRQAEIAPGQQEHTRQILSAASPLFWGQLLTYYCEALIYLDASEFKIIQIIEQTITLLDEISLELEHPLNWLRERLLGRVNHELGYLMRLNGHYGRSFQAYQDALPEFRNTDSIDEQADTLNNLAFVLALLGASKRAKAHIDQALELRQRLGQKYPLALSHNTRGLIYSQRGQHEMGRRECQFALGIFEELATPRGIGLAYNALGYILRKQGESWKSGEISHQQATECFQQSMGYFERAVNIFPEKITKPGQVEEPIRSWETFSEQGSLYREWGHLLNEQKDIDTALKFYARAVECQYTALEIARQKKMRFQEADTCDDLAKVFYDQGNFERANEWLQQALSLVPDGFISTSEQSKKDTPAPGEAYWLILGKAFWQEGKWALDALSQEKISKKKYQEYLLSAIRDFALAAHYFESYWPETSVYNERLNLMKNDVLKLRLPISEITSVVKEEAARHKIDVASFLHALNES